MQAAYRGMYVDIYAPPVGKQDADTIKARDEDKSSRKSVETTTCMHDTMRSSRLLDMQCGEGGCTPFDLSGEYDTLCGAVRASPEDST